MIFYEPSEISAAEKVTVASAGCAVTERCYETPREDAKLMMSLDPPGGRGVRQWIDPKLAAVYVIGNRSNHLCKIGYARDVRKRVLTIQGSSPVPIFIHHFVYVVGQLIAKLVESEVHECLSPERQHGEWFDVQPLVASAMIHTVIKERGYKWWDEAGRRELGFQAARLHARDWARYSRRGNAHD